MKRTLTLTQLHLFGTWHRDLKFDTCSICKESINETAPSAESGPTVDHFTEDASGHTLCVGACGHVFHSCCLQRWLERREVCPLCNAEWTTVKDYL